MSKVDFEKNVQEKMQELRFPPSDEVWKRVEAGIGEKKPRPFAFFWLPAAVLMLGVVGYYAYVNFASGVKYSNDKSNKSSSQPGQTIASKQHVQENTGAIPDNKVELPSSSSKNHRSNANDVHVPKSRVSKTSLNSAEQDSRELASTEHFENHQLPENFPSAKSNSDREPHYSLPISKGFVFSAETFSAQQLSSPAELNSSNKISSIAIVKKSDWEYGIHFSAGLSNLDAGLFPNDSLSQRYNSPSTVGGTGTGSGSDPSEVKSGPAFSIGGSISKWIGAKWKLGIGLQYQYFSNTIRIGQKIDSAIFVNQNSVSMSTVSGYYKSAGNTPYHNHYHFISLPVTVNWQFARQLSWENQVTYSRLIATNALHYDGANGAYYKDKELFNDNQFIFATALKFGWSKNKFQAGPQLQYACTNLFDEGIGSPRYLRSIGITANMNLSKN